MSEFIGSEPDAPCAFIQWKGTDVCMGFSCLCGANCHFDGYFAYSVKCPHCDRVYEMPCYVIPRLSSEAKTGHQPKELDPDEDMPVLPIIE